MSRPLPLADARRRPLRRLRRLDRRNGEAAPFKERQDALDRKARDVRDAALDARDDRLRRRVLDPVGASLSLPLVRVEEALDRRVVERLERDLGRFDLREDLARLEVEDADAGGRLVRPPREELDHLLRVRAVLGLPAKVGPSDDERVDHGVARDAALRARGRATRRRERLRHGEA